MIYLLLDIVQLSFMIIPILIIYTAYKLIRKRFNYLFTEIIHMVFICYVFILIYIVWFSMPVAFEYITINVIPFHTIAGYVTEIFAGDLSIKIIASNLLGNVLLTMPMGIYLYFNRISLRTTTAAAILVPIIIELGQLLLHYIGFATRSVDIDDIILNFAGMLIGYYLAKLCKFVKKSKYIG
ncbi:VanZ family protein [Oceanobacillus jeddahense]|uniref:VanZ family protein n=1 Tax=Oceanobacillus jeddahense TaxID=1462527 RepID=A0ABY5JY17_9BACI|nr:VanZ family protein [Oceanobacillus jeddahense]UUI04058.1 VanZ family protein [Oceanobacillus jeddahense]